MLKKLIKGIIRKIAWTVKKKTIMQVLIPIIDPLRLKLAKIMTKNPMAFLKKRLRDGMTFPYSERGYNVELYKDKKVYRIYFSRWQNALSTMGRTNG